MTTERLTRLDDDRLGAAVSGLDLAWPTSAAPSAQDVLDALAIAERHATPVLTRSRRRRLIVLIVAAILALTATALAARFVLDLRGLIIEQVPGPPVDVPTSPLRGPELGRPLELEEAAEAAGIEPAIPGALGPPDRVWLTEADEILPEGEGALLAMAWLPGPDLPVDPRVEVGSGRLPVHRSVRYRHEDAPRGRDLREPDRGGSLPGAVDRGRA